MNAAAGANDLNGDRLAAAVSNETYRSLVEEWSEQADLLVLPDRAGGLDGQAVVGFRPDAQSLRVYAASRGLKVALARPSDAASVGYQEHAAEWILPLVYFVGSVPAQVIATMLADWLRSRGADESDDVACYRRLRLSPDGSVEIEELRVPVRELPEAIEREAEDVG